jgi:hypothetical protein
MSPKLWFSIRKEFTRISEKDIRKTIHGLNISPIYTKKCRCLGGLKKVN